MYFIFFVLLSAVTSLATKPVVLWHGMGDSCCNPLSLGSLTKFMKEVVPDLYVHSLQIGDNFFEDTENGFLMNANKQIQIACDKIAKDPKLKDGYNAIGFSQGGQFLRAVAQRCPSPPMNHLISLGGQHQGVYGLPHCLYPQHTFCDYLRSILNYGAYWSWVQNSFVQAEYWHDPLNEDKYKAGSVFLADINQERAFNASYKNNLLAINNFVMVKFLNDTMVQPTETEWFGFYTPGQALNIADLVDSDLYKKDLLGLQQMNNEGRLIFLSVEGDHLQFSSKWFNETIIQTYLVDENNTLISNNI